MRYLVREDTILEEGPLFRGGGVRIKGWVYTDNSLLYFVKSGLIKIVKLREFGGDARSLVHM